jgi:hypothetical protein
MRAVASVAVILALILAGCGSLDRSPDDVDANEPAELTPVPGGGDGVPTPAIDPDRVGSAVNVAAGLGSAGPWGAWAYRQKSGSLCLEFVGGGGQDGMACGTEPSMMEATTSTSSSGRDGFMSGGTIDPSAVGAVIHLEDGSTTTAPLTALGSLSTVGARYYFTTIPPDYKRLTIDIVDASGNVLTTSTLVSL